MKNEVNDNRHDSLFAEMIPDVRKYPLHILLYLPQIKRSPLQSHVLRDTFVLGEIIGALGSRPHTYRWYFDRHVEGNLVSGIIALADECTPNRYIVLANEVGALKNLLSKLDAPARNGQKASSRDRINRMRKRRWYDLTRRMAGDILDAFQRDSVCRPWFQLGTTLARCLGDYTENNLPELQEELRKLKLSLRRNDWADSFCDFDFGTHGPQRWYASLPDDVRRIPPEHRKEPSRLPRAIKEPEGYIGLVRWLSKRIFRDIPHLGEPIPGVNTTVSGSETTASGARAQAAAAVELPKLKWNPGKGRLTVDGKVVKFRKELTQNSGWGQDEFARNAWIYEQCMLGVPHTNIVLGVKKNPKWELILSRQGIKAAATRFADKFGLCRPPSRKPGRHPKAD